MQRSWSSRSGYSTLILWDLESVKQVRQGEGVMSLHEILLDIHTLEEDLLAFERKYGIRSETFYAAYVSGEEPDDDSWALDFGEWASVHRTWLTRQAEYRNEV